MIVKNNNKLRDNIINKILKINNREAVRADVSIRNMYYFV